MKFIKGLAYFFIGLTLLAFFSSLNVHSMAKEEAGVIIAVLAVISLVLYYLANKKKKNNK